MVVVYFAYRVGHYVMELRSNGKKSDSFRETILCVRKLCRTWRLTLHKEDGVRLVNLTEG